MSLTDIEINFIRYRLHWGTLSLVLVLLSLVSLVIFGLSFGLDFSGGVLIELKFGDTVNPENIKQLLAKSGFQDAVVQFFGSSRDIIIRLPESTNQQLSTDIYNVVTAVHSDVELLRTEFVGAQVGEELRDQGGLGLLVALGVVLIYVTFRFQFKFAIGSVIALVHDVIIILGIFSIFGLDFDLSVLAALLAIIGYSLNDSIIVSDRIRENFLIRNYRDVNEIINASINQVLGRTIITSGTTLMVVAALLIFGGQAIQPFAIALFIGVTVGTYSSIYVVCNVLLQLKLKREDMLRDEHDSSEKNVV